MTSTRFTFLTLVVIVCMAGISQGLTLPLLAILLEQQGVSSVANGLNAAGLYMGSFLVSPLMEIVLRRFGFRTTVVIGLCLVAAATVMLPFLQGLIFWFILRIIIGIGDTFLHFTSQIWVTTISPPDRRGRDLSIYGLAYGIGFSIGPLGINLLSLGVWVPFVTVTLIFLFAFILLGRLPNLYPEPAARTAGGENRYTAVFRLAWLALIPSFLYGFMESSLNGNFPVYALRIGVSPEWVSVILPAFVVGSLFLQLPLGTLSDRIGRKKVMIICALAGGTAFALFPLAGKAVWLMIVLLAVAGAAVGSFYSLGLAFAADLLPRGMVPTAGMIAGMNFALASMLAPNLNGYLLDFTGPGTMFLVMGGLLGVFALLGLFFRERRAEKAHENVMASQPAD
ncbi:MFS transporter [Brevibacillus sp. B_LB10_24]|uniref:MFS transporter n=1 Tax=Brevibacillus sp. B_LB10_24 TaxID=3380645 RepID=UPI0038B6EEC9